jgi:hypothetical protein
MAQRMDRSVRDVELLAGDDQKPLERADGHGRAGCVHPGGQRFAVVVAAPGMLPEFDMEEILADLRFGQPRGIAAEVLMNQADLAAAGVAGSGWRRSAGPAVRPAWAMEG